MYENAGRAPLDFHTWYRHIEDRSLIVIFSVFSANFQFYFRWLPFPGRGLVVLFSVFFAIFWPFFVALLPLEIFLPTPLLTIVSSLRDH